MSHTKYHTLLSHINMMSGYTGNTGEGPTSSRRRVPMMITLPTHSTFDTLVSGISPGPMTLVSNFFSDHYPDTDLCSFSQLLDDVLASPTALNPPASLLYIDSSSSCQKELEEDKQHQSTDLVITRSLSDCNSSSFSPLQDMVPEPIVSITKPTSDGYNWRKYGQKQVKTSELPRCYYKCTQNNCPVTKKIGHFHDGNISEIIYKGQHNHEPPSFHKKARNGTPMDHQMSSVEEPVEVGKQVNHMVATELMADSKRRKTEVGYVDQASSSRMIVTAKSKIVVQTRSEVDILDDGFKWRKYGQKVVKGNTYPRGYYRCSYAGCKVRKHVERASSDPKSVLTTYEGKHKHDIPVVAKPSSSNETGIKAERPYSLQLKEEQIIA